MIKTTKKILGSLLACTLFMGLAGCSSDTSDSSSSTTSSDSQTTETTTTTTSYADAQQLLMAAWDEDTDENKPTSIGGLDAEMVSDLPAALNLEDEETLETTLAVTADLIENSESAASIMNAMMANYLTASVWQLTSDADIDSIAKGVNEKIKDSKWLCGTPEVYVIYQAGSFLYVGFGTSAQLDPLTEAFLKVEPSATELYSGTIS